jgi:hypothetical protein
VISEERLREAARRAGDAWEAGLPDPADCQHEFSPAFDRKMAKVLRKKSHPVRSSALRRVACLLLVLVLGSAIWLGVDAQAREAVFGWLRDRIEDVWHYSYQGEPPAEFSSYSLDVPEGYWLESRIDSDGLVDEYYRNEEGLYIDFTYQYTSDHSASELYVLDENTEVKQVVIHGQTADLYLSSSEDENNTIIWTDPSTGALIDVTAFMDEAELIALAETVTPEKN